MNQFEEERVVQFWLGCLMVLAILVALRWVGCF